MSARKSLLPMLASLALLLLLAAQGWAQTAPVTPSEIARAAHFEEPLVPTAATTPEEDRALVTALTAHERRSKSDDFTALSGFLTRYPHSGWAPALQTNLGLLYLHDGYFSRAITAWQDAWEQGKGATGVEPKALVDRAFGQLVRLESSLGHFDRVSALFKELGKRPIGGSSTELIQTAAEDLAQLGKDPRHLFNCGPIALQALLLAKGVPAERVTFMQWQNVGPNGTSLAELGQMAAKPSFAYRLIERKPGQQVPVPSVVHWKVGHYSAIVEERNGRFRITDPMSRSGDQWVTRDALDAEASGYFLVPADLSADHNWRTVPRAEAANIRGKGATTGVRSGDPADQLASMPDPSNPGDPNSPDSPINNPNGVGNPPCGSGGMCRYGIKESSVSISLSDTPVGYSPPIGPSAKVRITYNQREDSQPANFTFFNVSQKWTLNWLSYVTDDPANPGASVTRYLAGGGSISYSGYNGTTGRFTAQNTDGSILVRTSGPPITYQWLLPDGSVEVYAQSDGSGSYPRKIFLTQIIDPQGNALTLAYDGQLRLTTATDAVGRQTTFTYGLAAHPLQVTQITDPFGRSATLTYDGSGRLASITDVLGITSSVGYDANSLVNSLTTPYGTTTFAYTAPGTSAPPRSAQATDPMGFSEREEWLEPSPNPPTPDADPVATVPTGMPYVLYDHYLNYRNSFHWDKDAYVAAGCTPTGGCDYTKARIRHFTHVPPNTSIKNTSLESVKMPLENRIWYAYPGQSGGQPNLFGGTFARPIAVGRVLDDGTSQVRRFSYDTAGFYKMTQMVDPLGRTTNFAYSNQIDLAAISQTTAYGLQTTIAQYTYNYQHRPVTYTDAAGQMTSFAYNAAGQATSITNPLNQTTSYAYDTDHNLSTITNANNQTAATYTYDSFARVRTFTDSEGWTVTYDYDAADRITKKTYPDGTTDLYTYDKLDLVSYQDRQGRLWTYSYDADRRLTSVTDPAGEQTQYGYNHDGKLTSLTDPKTNTTNWTYDIEGRLSGKEYPDTSTVTYTSETTTSRLKSVTDALSQVKTYAYAQDDRLTGITYTGAVNPTPNVSFTYDPYFPRLTAMTDGTGTRQYTYVPVGSLGALQLQQESGPLPSSAITSAYDELGRLSQRTVQGAGAESFQYDAIGRLSVHTDDLGTFTLGYLGQTGQTASRQLASSTLATAWSYLNNTGDRRLSGIANTGLTAGQFSNFTYTTTPENFISSITESSDASAVYPAAGSQTATYNNLNQLTNLSGQALTFDANGNLTSDGQRTYAWDAENRLVGITYPGVSGKATAFTYDGLGRRAAISSTPAGGGSATLTSYLWCGDDICQARDAGNTILRSYYDEGEYLPGTPAQTLYYGIDQIGSVRRVFASAFSAPAYGYDPYGVPLQATAPITDFVYAGMFYNSDSRLYLTKYRAFDPVVGRWLSRDPIGEPGDVVGNLYAYVSGSPTSATDTSGLWASTTSLPPTGCSDHNSGDLTLASGDDDVVERYKRRFGKPPLGGDNPKSAIHQITPPPPVGFRPPNFSPPGAGRSGAFNGAKRGAGIPSSQQPATTFPNPSGPGTVYRFEVPAPGGGTKTIDIRDDSAGHFYGPGDPQNRGPHFNINPDPGQNRHFDY